MGKTDGRVRSISITVVFLFFGLLAFPSSAIADCAHWDATGYWGIRQSNNVTVALDLKQNQSRVTGRASYTHMVGELNQLKEEKGSVEGTLNGTEFSIEVRWRNGDIGIYNGTIAPDGKVSGTGYNNRDPNYAAHKVTWFSLKPVKCADAIESRRARASTGSGPPPANATKFEPDAKARSYSSKTNSASPAGRSGQPARKPPAIWADSTIVKIKPGKDHGLTSVFWDGGPEHPYAEVWVKTDGEDNKFIVERGTGAKMLPIKPGRNVFILTDSGKQLASVVVEGKQ